MRVGVSNGFAFLLCFFTLPTLDAERDPNMCIYMLDLYPKENLPKCDRLTYLSGSSISNEIISKVDKITEDKEKILVILDSNHT